MKFVYFFSVSRRGGFDGGDCRASVFRDLGNLRNLDFWRSLVLCVARGGCLVVHGVHSEFVRDKVSEQRTSAIYI